MTSIILIIVSGDPENRETTRLREFIENRALLLCQNFFVTQDPNDVVVVQNNPEIEVQITFVLGDTPLDQWLVNLLLDEKWRAKPMSVVAVTETGAGAQGLRSRQIEILGPDFDNGVLTNGIEQALVSLIPYRTFNQQTPTTGDTPCE